jgi:hypothetical protein
MKDFDWTEYAQKDGEVEEITIYLKPELVKLFKRFREGNPGLVFNSSDIAKTMLKAGLMLWTREESSDRCS